MWVSKGLPLDRLLGNFLPSPTYYRPSMRNPQSTAALNNEKRADWNGRCLLARARQQLGSELSCLQTACHGADHPGIVWIRDQNKPQVARRAPSFRSEQRGQIQTLVACGDACAIFAGGAFKRNAKVTAKARGSLEWGPRDPWNRYGFEGSPSSMRGRRQVSATCCRG